MSNLKNVVYISSEDYADLIENGSTIINDQTVTYDENNLYILPDDNIENPMTSSGDMIIAGAGGVPTRLAVGNDGKVLKIANGVPTWGDAGTVTSVSAGVGLSISGTASVNPTVNVDSNYKLPTSAEWSTLDSAVGEKYVKPTGGIPDSDLASTFIHSGNYTTAEYRKGGLVIGAANSSEAGGVSVANGRIYVTGQTNPLFGLKSSDSGSTQFFLQVTKDDMYVGPTSTNALNFNKTGATTLPNTLTVKGDVTVGTSSINKNITVYGNFIKNGGTSSQFLKADGSVDSTAYTTNIGTVTSVNGSSPDASGAVTIAVGTGTVTSVSAGTGLSISGDSGINPTVNIDSDYTLPTTVNWTSLNNTVASINNLAVFKVNNTTPTNGNVDVQGSGIKSGTTGSYAASGTILTADGSGAASWQTPPKEIFWCTYGTTTFQQIADAITAGYYPAVKYGNFIYGNCALHPGEDQATGGRYYFESFYGSYTRLYARCSSNGDAWTTGTSTFGSYSKPAGGIPATDLADTYIKETLIDASGDLIVGSADNIATRLAKGSNGQILLAGDSTLSWTSSYWTADFSSTATNLSNGTDLDTITTPGSYKVASSAAASTMVNGPETATGYAFQVVKGGGGSAIYQIAYVNVPEYNGAAGMVWIRARDGNNANLWHPWVRYAMSAGTFSNGNIPYYNTSNKAFVDSGKSYTLLNNIWANPMTTAGDMIYRDSSGATRLAKGTAGQVLTMNSGATAPEWQTPHVYMDNPMTQPGDLIIGGTSGTPTRLVNNASTSFLKGAAGSTYWGDVNGTDVKATSVTADKVLTADGSGNASWTMPEGYVHSIMSGITTEAGSSSSSSYLSVKWTVDDVDGITTPFDGMKVAIKIPLAGVGTAGAVFSIDGGTTYHPIAYNVNTVFTTHFPVGSTKVFTYNASQSMNAYLTAKTVSSIQGVWQADANYDTNTTMTYGTLAYYFRPYNGANTLYRYKLVALDKDNRVVPIVTTNRDESSVTYDYSSSTTYAQDAVVHRYTAASGSHWYKSLQANNKGHAPEAAASSTWWTLCAGVTPTTVAFNPSKIYWYSSTTNVSAGAVLGANTLEDIGYNATWMAYANFNEGILAYRLFYLCGTYNQETGLFTLRDGGTNGSTLYYTSVPDNTANINLSTYFTSGYDYILVGGSYSTNNYLHIMDNNPMFHFDGTNLVPYDTWVAKTTPGTYMTASDFASNPPTGVQGQILFVIQGE